MDRIFIWVSTDMNEVGIEAELQALNNNLLDGWQLDPVLKVIKLENMAIYHLIKFSEEEKQTQNNETKITSVKSVDINEVDELLKEGYEVEALFAKTATLVKKEQVKEA